MSQRLSLIVGVLFSFMPLLGTASSAHAEDAAQPRVLILGDSISIGYTPTVKELLKSEAVVIRPDENCAGTTKGVEAIDKWLAIDGGKWDVIHFNFGLHDMKRENATTKQASNDPNDPRQADAEQYEKNLREIVGKLKKTGAKLIFATTTPVPKGVKPHRDTTDPQIYNDIAKKIMAENEVAIDDLYGFAEPKPGEIQQKANVHFSPAGSKVLANEVAASIRKALE